MEINTTLHVLLTYYCCFCPHTYTNANTNTMNNCIIPTIVCEKFRHSHFSYLDIFFFEALKIFVFNDILSLGHGGYNVFVQTNMQTINVIMLTHILAVRWLTSTLIQVHGACSVCGCGLCKRTYISLEICDLAKFIIHRFINLPNRELIKNKLEFPCCMATTTIYA